MKKTIACICILFGVLCARADVVTNYVYIVSNIFNNVYTESVVTQKVKSSHTDFYYTNYVSVVTNVYQTMFRTNVSVNVDVSQTYVNAAANAASNALSFANQSAASASAAGSSASTASSAASMAAVSAASASSAAADGLQRINERINWFDQHSGETITNVNISTNITYYVPAEDYSHPYTEPISGVVHDNLRVFDRSIYGALRADPIQEHHFASYDVEHHACLRYKVVFSTSTSESSKKIFLEQAYIDTDQKGIRIHYLPIDKTRPLGLNNDSSKYYMVRDFYWQNDGIYVTVDCHTSANAFSGRIVVKSADVATGGVTYKYDNAFPNYHSGANIYKTLVSRTGTIMGNYIGFFIAGESQTSSTNGIWMKSEMSDDQRDIYNWIRSFPGP